jgi:hypothetical protein
VETRNTSLNRLNLIIVLPIEHFPLTKEVLGVAGNQSLNHNPLNHRDHVQFDLRVKPVQVHRLIVPCENKEFDRVPQKDKYLLKGDAGYD